MTLAQILFFLPIIATIILTIYFGINVLKRSQRFIIALLSATLLNIALLGAASIWWLSYPTESMSQVIGAIVYGISAVIILFIDAAVLFWWRNRYAGARLG